MGYWDSFDCWVFGGIIFMMLTVAFLAWKFLR